MTSTRSPERVAVLGTGLVGTSIAMAALRAGCDVVGWDPDERHLRGAASRAGLRAAASADEATRGADLVVVATPIASVAATVARALRVAGPDAVVTDVASIKAHVAAEVAARSDGAPLERFVPGHPMGGSERSGPEHASASVVDGIVWAITPTDRTAGVAVDRLEAFVRAIGARPVRLDPARHDRLVAVVSHLPQVASTALMSLAATEEADEPDILLLAAGGFRDLTRLAASNPALWSEILVANRDEVVRAIDLYVERLARLRAEIASGADRAVEGTFAAAKGARLGLGAKPQVRAGVAVLQVPIPDRPGSLAQLTGGLAEGGVNIEDLQIVHSAEGGAGLVHLTVAASSADAAGEVLAAHGFDHVRIA